MATISISPSYSAISGTLSNNVTILTDWKSSWSTALTYSSATNYTSSLNSIDSSIDTLINYCATYFSQAQVYYRSQFDDTIGIFHTYALLKYNTTPGTFSSTVTSLTAEEIAFFGDKAINFQTTVYVADPNAPTLADITSTLNMINWYAYGNYQLEWTDIGDSLFEIEYDDVTETYSFTVSSTYNTLSTELNNLYATDVDNFENEFYLNVNGTIKQLVNYMIFAKPKAFITEDVDINDKLLNAPFSFSQIFNDFTITISGLYP